MFCPDPVLSPLFPNTLSSIGPPKSRYYRVSLNSIHTLALCVSCYIRTCRKKGQTAIIPEYPVGMRRSQDKFFGAQSTLLESKNPPLSPSFSQKCGDALASCYSNKMSMISISFFFQKGFLWGHSCRVSSPWPISPVTSWEHKTEQALSAHGHEAKIRERDMGPTMAFKSP